MRVDLENRIQSLKEELAFQTEVHKQVYTIQCSLSCLNTFSYSTVLNSRRLPVYSPAVHGSAHGATSVSI